MTKHEEDYIYDGKVHALSNEEAYIIKKETAIFFQDRDAIEQRKMDYCKEIAEYLLSVDYYTAIYWLAKYIKENMCQDLQFIISEPQKISILAQYGTIACRFIRCKDDGRFFLSEEELNQDKYLGHLHTDLSNQTYGKYLTSKGANKDSKVVFRRAGNLSVEEGITTYQDIIDKKKKELEILNRELTILEAFAPDTKNAY